GGASPSPAAVASPPSRKRSRASSTVTGFAGSRSTTYAIPTPTASTTTTAATPHSRRRRPLPPARGSLVRASLTGSTSCLGRFRGNLPAPRWSPRHRASPPGPLRRRRCRPPLTARDRSRWLTVVTGTTGRHPTGLADVVGDVDLPSRLLVFGVARHDGTIPAADLFAVAEACGRSPEQVR